MREGIMLKDHRAPILMSMLTGLCLSACDAGPAQAPSSHTKAAPAIGASHNALSGAFNGIIDGCAGDRWIGRWPDAHQLGCPQIDGAPDYVAGWASGPLYSGGPIGEMSDACVYEWQGDQPIGQRPHLRLDQGPINNEWLEPDCHVVGAQAPKALGAKAPGPRLAGLSGAAGPSATLSPTSSDRFAEIFFEDLWSDFQILAGDAALLPHKDGVAGMVRVAVVDTAITAYDRGRPSYGRADHGRDMGLVARGVACNSSGCFTAMDSLLGLPRVDIQTPDPLQGGYFGFQTELAQGIYRAVERWVIHNNTPGLIPHDRLIINLSVGWSGRFGGDLASGLSAPVYEVYQAIQYARCNGAMVVAAAGNTEFGPAPESGALYPAAWGGAQLAPTEAECLGLFPALAPRLNALSALGYGIFAAGDDPLVYPIAGLDAEDQPLYNARPDTLTPLMAPGAQVAAPDRDRDDDGWLHAPVASGIYTGSSVSTAAISGAASAVWAVDPAMTPAEVYGLLLSTGASLPSLGQSDVARSISGIAPPPPRRVILCEALIAACRRHGGLCDAAKLSTLRTNCVPLAEGDGAAYGGMSSHGAELEALFASLDPSVAVEVDLSGLSLVSLEGEGCAEGTVLAAAEDSEAFSCSPETTATRALTPWVGPQPGDTICPDCALNRFDVYMPISYPSERVIDPALTVYTETETYSVALGDVDSSLSEITSDVTVKLGGLPLTSGAKEAYFTYSLENKDGTLSAGQESFTIYK